MGPELSTAAADQNFAWICKQYQDLIGSILIFRTKFIWSGQEFGLVRCGYLNAAEDNGPRAVETSGKLKTVITQEEVVYFFNIYIIIIISLIEFLQSFKNISLSMS